MFARVAKSTSAATIGGIGIFSGVVALGLLPESRRGMRAGYLYPYSYNYEGTFEETSWRVVVAGLGFSTGAGGAFKVVPSKNPLIAVPRIFFGFACGMVTAKLCYDYSHIPVIVGIKTTKIISYTLDGFLADVFGRSEGQVAKWEEEGVDLESLLEDRNDDEAQALKSMKTASMIEDAWNNGTLEESEKSRELHKTFLIRNLIDLREKEKQYEQRKADAENLMKQLRGTPEEDTGYERFQDACDNLSSIRDRKAMEKERCLEVHGLSLSKVILADIAIAAMDLTSHRREQLALASDYKLATDGPEKAKIRTKIKLIDVKKKALKHKIKKNYHFQLSHHRNSLSVKSCRFLV